MADSWTVSELLRLDINTLDTLVRSRCIKAKLPLPYTMVDKNEAHRILVGVQKETYEEARNSYIVQREEKNDIRIRRASLPSKETFGKREASRLKRKLKSECNKKYVIASTNPLKLQQKLYEQFKRAVNFKEKTIAWSQLSSQLICAYILNDWNELDYDEIERFFEYIRLFFKMIDARGREGIRSLSDKNMHYWATVKDWIKRLLFISKVEQYGDTDCYVRATVKKGDRPKHSLVVDITGERKKFVAAVYVSFLSEANYDRDGKVKEKIFTNEYDASHFGCDFGSCLEISHIKRESIQKNVMSYRNLLKKKTI